MTSRVLVALRVAASPERAFAAFTEETSRWWRPNALFAFARGRTGTVAFEPGLGGRFTETYEDGSNFEIGRITAWDPGRRLVFSWRQDSFAEDQVTEVEVRFEPVGDETRITVEHKGWETVPQEHVARHHFPDAIFLQRHAEWWRNLLEGLSARSAPR